MKVGAREYYCTLTEIAYGYNQNNSVSCTALDKFDILSFLNQHINTPYVIVFIGYDRVLNRVCVTYRKNPDSYDLKDNAELLQCIGMPFMAAKSTDRPLILDIAEQRYAHNFNITAATELAIDTYKFVITQGIVFGIKNGKDIRHGRLFNYLITQYYQVRHRREKLPPGTSLTLYNNSNVGLVYPDRLPDFIVDYVNAHKDKI